MRRLLLIVAFSSAVSCGSRSSPVEPTSSTLVPAGSFTLSGSVVETAPTSSTPIADATVTLVEGPNIGSATTDAAGRFHLSGLRPGGVTIRIRAANHVEDVRFIEIAGDQTIDIQLDPAYQILTTTSLEAITGGGDACPGYWDTYPESRACAVDFVFDVHHSGVLKAEAVPADSAIVFSMELYASVDGRVASAGTPLDSSRPVDVRSHTQYVIRVRKFSSSGASPPPGVASFTFTVSRPS